MKDESLEVFEAQVISVTEAQSRAEIDIQISTAKRYPRSPERATQNVIAIISKDELLARTCVYSLPRGGKTIDGPSVHLARLIASEYKNLRVDSKIVEIGETMITAQSVCLDLENNFAVRTEVKRRITDKHGQRYAEDMIVMTCNAALSIASRNAILQVVPASATQKIFEAAKKAITGDLSTEQALLKRRKEVLDGYKQVYGVKEEEILALLELETVNQIKEAELLTLIGLANAIKEGDTTVAEAFQRTKENATTADTKQKVAAAIAKAKERKSNQNQTPKE